jgi:hypothetical protein
MSIHLHIERLVIDESLLGTERAGAVRAAIERRLAERLAMPGALETLRGLGVVAELSPARLPPARHASDPLGPRIATAVQQGLGFNRTEGL